MFPYPCLDTRTSRGYPLVVRGRIRRMEKGTTKRPYTKLGRLQEVLALIQVLSLDEYTHRSEQGMNTELQGGPSSSDSWTDLAREHPEFFRVRSDDKNIALVARHVMPKDAAGHKRELPSEIMQKLFQTAIDLHDRQIAAAEWWKSFMPLWAALIGGILGTASTLVTLWFQGFQR